MGRRRQIQKILREFANPQYGGVLIHGFGRQGKPSLAARISSRMKNRQVVVVYGSYDALSIIEAIEYFAGTPEIQALISTQREALRDSGENLFPLLKQLLEGPCRENPILLVIDDFEQALAEPVPGELHRVKGEYIDAIRSVLQAFAGSAQKSLCRLLLTSRYRFTLPYRGRELADTLLPIHLPPMEEYEGKKQAAAKEKASGYTITGETVTLIERCIHTARGNPGLQDLLFRLCLQSPEAGKQALEEADAFISSGKYPEEQSLLDFISNLAVEKLVGLLSSGERELLRVSGLFSLPVPLACLQFLAEKLALDGGEPFGRRLFAFGMWQPFADMVDPEQPALQRHSLTGRIAGELSPKEEVEMAGLVIDELFRLWGGGENKRRPDATDIELARLAVLAKNMAVTAAVAEDAVYGLKNRFQYREAAQMAGQAIAVLDGAGVEPDPGLLRVGCEVCQTTGDIDRAKSYISRALSGLEAKKGEEWEQYARALVIYGRLLVQSGEPAQALSFFEEAQGLLTDEDNLKEKAVTLGDIARIQTARGNIEEALKLHLEVLDVFDQLGDTRSRAVTLGDIANIQSAMGNTDESIKLHQEELEIYEKIGDLDSKAVTLYEMAQIEIQQESIEKALKYLLESYVISTKINRLDVICFVGLSLGPLLFKSGNKEEGRTILQRSIDGFRKLDREDLAQQAGETLNRLTNPDNPQTG